MEKEEKTMYSSTEDENNVTEQQFQNGKPPKDFRPEPPKGFGHGKRPPMDENGNFHEPPEKPVDENGNPMEPPKGFGHGKRPPMGENGNWIKPPKKPVDENGNPMDPPEEMDDQTEVSSANDQQV